MATSMRRQGEIEQLMDRVSGVMSLIGDRIGYIEEEIKDFISTGQIDPYLDLHPAINTAEKMYLLLQGSDVLMDLYQVLGEELSMILDEVGNET